MDRKSKSGRKTLGDLLPDSVQPEHNIEQSETPDRSTALNDETPQSQQIDVFNQPGPSSGVSNEQVSPPSNIGNELPSTSGRAAAQLVTPLNFVDNELPTRSSKGQPRTSDRSSKNVPRNSLNLSQSQKPETTAFSNNNEQQEEQTNLDLKLRRLTSKLSRIKLAVDSRRFHFCKISESRKAKNVLVIMLFFGMINAFFLRTNLLVTIESLTSDQNKAGLYSYKCMLGSKNAPEVGTKLKPFSLWSATQKHQVFNAYFYGYCLTQIPSGILAHKYGSKLLLGIGMVLNTILGFLIPITVGSGAYLIMILRFFQGIGEGPVIPCCHIMLSNWSAPYERSRNVTFVYCGAQIGTAITLSLSKLVSTKDLIGGWPTTFYILSGISTIWLVCFYIFVYEDPVHHPALSDKEKIRIFLSIWGRQKPENTPIPWKSIMKSQPFWAIFVSHLANSYGYEVIHNEIPLFLKAVIKFNIKTHAFYAAVPYCTMCILAIVFSFIIDELIWQKKFTTTTARKVANSIGQLGPALALAGAAISGCNAHTTLGILTIGLGLNGAVYSGFFANHIDIAPNFAGIMIALTNCCASVFTFLVRAIANFIIYKNPAFAVWIEVFAIALFLYIFGSVFYLFFASGQRQYWIDLLHTETLTQFIKKRFSRPELETVV